MNFSVTGFGGWESSGLSCILPTTVKVPWPSPTSLNVLNGSFSTSTKQVAIPLCWSIVDTLERSMKGTDHVGSLEKSGLKYVLNYISQVEQALGTSDKKVLESEMISLKKLRSDLIWKLYITVVYILFI